MFTLETKTHVEGLTGREIFEFLANPSDREYQRWWPGVHLELHTLSRVDGHVGDVVLMNELVGSRRVRLMGTVVEAVSGKRLVWQLKAAIRLPIWLSLARDAARTARGRSELPMRYVEWEARADSADARADSWATGRPRGVP